MTLRCSLFGHDFTEPETRREREERGNEVVTTVEEVRTCRRCGEERVVSENTEVTAVESGEPAGAVEPRESDPTAEQEHDPVTDAEAGANAAAATTTDAATEAAVEDDAVILDDEPEDDADRESGQWPDADDTRVEDAADEEADAAASDDAGETEAPAAEEAADDGGEILAGSDETTADADDGEEDSEDELPPGETTEPAGSPAADEVVEPDPVPEKEGGVNVDAELVCPNCGFSEASLGSSHRQGDICPSCRQGYLAER